MQERVHPIRAAVVGARGEIAGVAGVDPLFMTGADQVSALGELLALRAQTDELVARLLVGMDASGEVVESAGLRDLAFWFAETTREGLRAGQAEVRFARGLAAHPRVAEAMRAGVVSAKQAVVIMAAVDALPDDLPEGLVDDLRVVDESGSDVAGRAEASLLGSAARFGPRELAVLGRRIVEVVAPEIADEVEARKLEAAERRAVPRIRLSLRAVGDGTTRLSGRLPDLAANELLTMLDALISPRRTPEWAGAGEGEREGQAFCSECQGEPHCQRCSGGEVVGPRPWWMLPQPDKLGFALVELIGRIPSDVVGMHGNTAATLFVTVTLDQLRAGLGAGIVQGPRGEDMISAAEARRLACSSNLIPAVMGSRGEVLDLGRQSRLFSPAQSKALRLRHRGCQGSGCMRPASHCEAHHHRSWLDGGPTDLGNALLLCSRCHHRAHDPCLTYEVSPTGEVTFTPRPS